MIKIHGFTLIEMLIAIAILGIIASLAIPSFSDYVDRTNNADAMSDISVIQGAIERFQVANNRFPNNLAEIGLATKVDAWGNTYSYINLFNFPGNIRGARRDLLNIPINSDYDLYSKGKDTLTRQPISGTDDIVRGRNGRFIGEAEDY